MSLFLLSLLVAQEPIDFDARGKSALAQANASLEFFFAAESKDTESQQRSAEAFVESLFSNLVKSDSETLDRILYEFAHQMVLFLGEEAPDNLRNAIFWKSRTGPLSPSLMKRIVQLLKRKMPPLELKRFDILEEKMRAELSRLEDVNEDYKEGIRIARIQSLGRAVLTALGIDLMRRLIARIYARKIFKRAKREPSRGRCYRSLRWLGLNIAGVSFAAYWPWYYLVFDDDRPWAYSKKLVNGLLLPSLSELNSKAN